MRYQYNDGGRSRYFAATNVGDCVTRAVAIASDRDYKAVYDEIRDLVGYSPRNSIKHKDVHKVVDHFGGEWHPLMSVGSGCRAHLRDGEIPMGRIICRCSGHLVAVIDGVVNDTYDSTRGGGRCVYGYWRF